LSVPTRGVILVRTDVVKTGFGGPLSSVRRN
jgi:hypothetical protein